MRTKTRYLLITAAVVVLSVMVWSIVAAQDATSTAEPNPAATSEPSASATTGTHPFLGVSLEPAANGTAGIAVAEVVDGSGAANAGIQSGDIITAIDGKAVTTPEEAAAAVAAHKVGDSITIDLTRNGSKMTVTATLGEQTSTIQPTTPGRGPRGNGNGINPMSMFGIQYNSDDQSWTISNLPDNSPLYTAGLRQGDVIKTFDGKAYDPQSLAQYLQSLAGDAKVTLGVDRNGQTQDIQISVSDLKGFAVDGLFGGILHGDFGNGNFPMMPFFPFMYGNGRLGVTFETIDADVAKANNLTVTDGALITAVEAGTPAEKAGLKVNDVITAVDGDKVDQERTLRDRLIAYEPGDTVTLTVLRDGKSQDIQATLDQAPMPSMDGNGNFPFNFNFQGPRGFRFGLPNQNGQNIPEATPEATPNL